jgi:outer membrane lipoprotein LolB
MTRRRLAGLAAGLLLGGLVTGCAVRPPAPTVSDDSVRLADWTAPVAPAVWQLNGRTSLRLGEEGATASLTWRQDDAAYRIDLRGALGVGSLRIRGDADGVTVRTADGERYRADSPRELVRAVSGYDLPVGFLRYWVIAQPVPWLEGRVRLDDAGRPGVIRQGGWRVRYDEFESVDGYSLPGRVAVTREKTSIRLVVRRWRPGE